MNIEGYDERLSPILYAAAAGVGPAAGYVTSPLAVFTRRYAQSNSAATACLLSNCHRTSTTVL